MITKKCTSCGVTKPVSEFNKNAKGKFGVRSRCAECGRQYHKELRATQPDRTRGAAQRYKTRNREKISLAGKLYYEKNKARSAERRRVRYQENKEFELERNRRWAKRNPEAALALGRKSDAKRRATPRGKLDNAISAGVHRGLTSGAKSGRRTYEILGYSRDELMKWLERQFLPGMSWENYGDWHIDHEIPLAVHNYETPDDIDFKRAWALTNLRPLWAKDNMSKGARINGGFQPSLALSVSN